MSSASQFNPIICLHDFCYDIKKTKNIFKNNIYTCKQPLMMAYERSESTHDNLDKLINQFPPKTKTLVRKLERIWIKGHRQNMFLLFNQTCLNEGLLPNYKHIWIYIYIHVFMCVFVCVWGLAKMFIGWSSYSHRIWPSKVYFST